MDRGKWKAIWDSLKLYCLYLFIPALLLLIGMTLRRGQITVDEFMDQSGDFYTVLGFGAAIAILVRRAKKRGASFCEEAMLYPRELAPSLGAELAILGFGLSMALSSALTVIPLPGNLIGSYGEVSGKLFYGPDQILVFLSVLILAPVAEEIIFRGLMMFRLQREFNEKQSVLISAFLFAILHKNILWILYAFAMAWLLGYTASRMENVCGSIAIHMGFNMASIPLMWVNRTPALAEIVMGSKLQIALYGCIGGLLAAVMVRRLRKRGEEKWLKI